MPSYWLMKSEKKTYSIDDFKKDKKTLWDGVRNYQARNFMKQMKKKDLFFFYHSNEKPSGVVGLGELIQEAKIDPTSLDPKSPYYDAYSLKKTPRWFCVGVCFKEKFKKIIPLDLLRKQKSLKKALFLQKGSRLSVSPLSKEEFKSIKKLANEK